MQRPPAELEEHRIEAREVGQQPPQLTGGLADLAGGVVEGRLLALGEPSPVPGAQAVEEMAVPDLVQALEELDEAGERLVARGLGAVGDRRGPLEGGVDARREVRPRDLEQPAPGRPLQPADEIA